jgi:tripartite-type tricarboxylate transporter receptor subunit TctC
MDMAEVKKGYKHRGSRYEKRIFSYARDLVIVKRDGWFSSGEQVLSPSAWPMSLRCNPGIPSTSKEHLMSIRPVLNRRQSLAGGAALLAAPWVRAQNFPERQLTIVVPAPPGGTADIAARALVEPLGKALGQSIVIDNKGGASGATGAQAVLNARPDGHTLLMAFSGFNVMSPHLVKLPYDPMKDIQPVCNVYSAPQVMVVRSSLEQIKTAQDLIRYAKSNPGRLNYASAGNGSVQHIAAELFKSITGTFITHIPYRGTGPMVTDLLGNTVDLTLTTAPPLIPHIQSGKFRGLLVAARRRLSSLPNVPTAEEVGVKNFEVASWFALYTHAQAPKSAVDRVASEVQKIMATAAFRERAASQGAEAAYLDPTQMGAFAAIEFQRWGKVIRDSKIKAD